MTFIKKHIHSHFLFTKFNSFCSSWLCCYMAQMNPLIGPKLSKGTILIMAREWGNELK